MIIQIEHSSRIQWLVGKDRPFEYQQWAETVGKFTLCDISDRELWFLKFAQSRRVKTQHPASLQEIQMGNSALSAKTKPCPGAYIGKDYILALTSIKLMLEAKRS